MTFRRVVAMAACACLVALATSSRAQRDANALRASHHSLYDRGQVAAAIPIAEDEAALRRAQGNVLELAAALHDLGVYLALAGQPEHARACLEEALVIRRAAPSNTGPLVAETLLALVPLRSGDESRAAAEEAYRLRCDAFGNDSAPAAEARYWLVLEDEVALRDVLRIQQRELGPDHALIARTLRALDNADLSEPWRSEQYSRESLAMLRRVYGPDDPRLFDGMFDLAFKLRSAGEIQESIDLLAEGLAIYEKQFDVHPRMINCRNGIAIMSNDLQRYAESERLMRRNLRDCRILYPDDSVQSAFVTINLALTCMFLGQCAHADSLLDDATARAGVLGERGEDVTHLAHTIGAYRGRLATWCGRYAEAEVFLKAAQERAFARNYPPGHEQIVKSYLYLGEARAGAGDFRGAESYFDQAVESYETVRSRIGPGTRPASFQKTPYEYRALARLASNRPEDAWQDIERSRGRLLSDSLLGGAIPFPLARVQRALGADDAIVGWVDHELPDGSPLAYAYVVRSTGSVRWVQLPADRTERVFARAERYRRFRAAIVDAGYSAFGGAEFPGDEARRIWKERVAPLMGHLDGATTLTVIPSDAMAALPLDALVDETGRFAGDRFAIRQAPSASVYAWLCEQSRGTGKTPRSGLLVGDPPFREEHLAAWTRPAMETASRGRADPATLRGAVRRDQASLEALPRLPWSREEVESIAALLPDATVLLGADASRESIERLAANGELARFDVVHLATHALVDDLTPERSALVLAQVGCTKDADARGTCLVTAEEIDGWHLNAELVTLSACETALGRNVFGEGTIGFAYPLLRAGARSLLASRWPVNDEATALLMGRFYSNWIGAKGATRMTTAEALREARVWLRQWRDRSGSRPYEHPYYWASFVLVGR